MLMSLCHGGFFCVVNEKMRKNYLFEMIRSWLETSKRQRFRVE